MLGGIGFPAKHVIPLKHSALRCTEYVSLSYTYASLAVVVNEYCHSTNFRGATDATSTMTILTVPAYSDQDNQHEILRNTISQPKKKLATFKRVDGIQRQLLQFVVVLILIIIITIFSNSE